MPELRSTQITSSVPTDYNFPVMHGGYSNCVVTIEIPRCEDRLVLALHKTDLNTPLLHTQTAYYEHKSVYHIGRNLGSDLLSRTFTSVRNKLSGHFTAQSRTHNCTHSRRWRAVHHHVTGRQGGGSCTWPHQDNKAAISLQLSRPNLLHCQEEFNVLYMIFLVMDYIQRGDLEVWLQNQGGPPSESYLSAFLSSSLPYLSR